MRRKAQWARLAAVGMLAAALVWGAAAGPGSSLGPVLGGRVFAAVRHGKKRLILKDGTYRDVVKYRVRNGRVRYLKEKRGEWKEAPESLVDWKATKQWNKEHRHGVQPGDEEFENLSPAEALRQEKDLDREEHAQRAAVKDLMPYVKPGLRLPDEDGIFALDTYEGRPELVHLQQADGDLNQNPFHSVQAVDVYRMHAFREVVRMRGLRARVQLHDAKPVFYVSVHGGPLPEPDNAFVVDTHGDSEAMQGTGGGSAHSRFVIVRVVRQGDGRVIYAKQLRNGTEPDASGMRTPTKDTLLPGGYWMKVTPVQALEPGEYVLVELLAPKVVNRDVWDFGVNPGAPENQQVRLPVR